MDFFPLQFSVNISTISSCVLCVVSLWVGYRNTSYTYYQISYVIDSQARHTFSSYAFNQTDLATQHNTEIESERETKCTSYKYNRRKIVPEHLTIKHATG
jgi:hypothetical protein